MLARQLRERLVRALEDALGRDVDPGAGRHLAVHRQPLALQLAERLPVRPLADEVRVRDQHPRRPLVGPEDADRLARLDEQRLVVLQPPQLADDGVEARPVPGGLARPAVDDQVIGPLGDLRVEVVHEHPQRGFLLPALARQLGAARRPDRAAAGLRLRSGEGHGGIVRCVATPVPAARRSHSTGRGGEYHQPLADRPVRRT